MFKWIVVFAAAVLAVFFGVRLALRRAPASGPAMRTTRMVRCAMIAAVYVVVCLALQPFSYGAVQVRLSEALCLLPIFGPEYIVGVTLGCLLANALGSTVIDVVFGTLATLLACLVTWKLRSLRIRGLALPAAVPPVLFNAVIVGWEISVFFSDTPAALPVMLFNMLTVGIGEVISCGILGVALIKLIEQNRSLRQLFIEGGHTAAAGR